MEFSSSKKSNYSDVVCLLPLMEGVDSRKTLYAM